MQTKEVKISDLRVAEYNPRHKSEHVLRTIRQSIRDYGILQPLVVNTHQCPECGDRRGVIVGGHRRLEAAQAEGLELIPAVEVDLHIREEKRANLRLNAQEKFKKQELAGLIAELHSLEPESVKAIGFSADEIVNYLFRARYGGNKIQGILQQKFLVPPFSVFDAKQGYWQKRKNLWKETMGSLSETRETTLAKGENNLLMRGINQGTSQFDPVIAEVIYQWFMPEKGVILDPFAGEQTKAFVAAALGFEYHGVEIRQDQIETNKRALESADLKANFYAGNSKDLNSIVPQDLRADLIFTSPPYYDLEIYSKGEGDISAKQTYAEFMSDYKSIFEQAVSHLKENRFVILKIGDIRDEKGFFRNFLGDNIALFKKLGFELYNEIIYVEMLATAPHRAERNMRKRKVVKTHQNLLTFYKGDAELLKSPRLLEIHSKILGFFKGDPETIKNEFKNPPPIQRDIVETLRENPQNQP